MAFPEHLEDVLEAGFFGVVVNVDRLGVVAEVVVGRVQLLPSCIADARSDDPFGRSELRLGKPKSGHPEGGLLRREGRFVERHCRSPEFTCPWSHNGVTYLA